MMCNFLSVNMQTHAVRRQDSLKLKHMYALVSMVNYQTTYYSISCPLGRAIPMNVLSMNEVKFSRHSLLMRTASNYFSDGWNMSDDSISDVKKLQFIAISKFKSLRKNLNELLGVLGEWHLHVILVQWNCKVTKLTAGDLKLIDGVKILDRNCLVVQPDKGRKNMDYIAPKELKQLRAVKATEMLSARNFSLNAF